MFQYNNQVVTQPTKQKDFSMKYIYLAFNWAFGAVLALFGLVALIDTPLAGLTLISMSLLLLPPVRKFIYSKTNKEITTRQRIYSIFALCFVLVFFITQDASRKKEELVIQQAKEKSDQVVKIQQENIKYFNDNREQIMNSIKKELNNKNYASVSSLSSKYLISGDKELKELNTLASQKLAEIRKVEKTKSLLAEVKKVPASELVKNNNIYKQLSSLHPNNETYKNKVISYTKKIKEEEKNRLAAEAREEEIKIQFSAWDGSHRNLERVIKEAMNDPDSYEHDKTVYWDRGDHLVVQMTYRGRNGFGGMVRNFVKAKISLSGQVLQILDQS